MDEGQVVFVLCGSDFFVARYLEDQDIRNREKENQPPSVPVPEASPPTAPPKDKKGGDKGNEPLPWASLTDNLTSRIILTLDAFLSKH